MWGKALPESNRIVSPILRPHYSSPNLGRSNPSLRHSVHFSKKQGNKQRETDPALTD